MIKWPCGITYETKVVVQNTIVKQPWFNSRSLHYSQAYKPPITRTNQHIILHIKKVTERALQYHLQRYLWFLNKSIISKRKKYSGFCKILVFLSMEKSLGAIKHPQITYWPFHYCGLNSRFRSFYGLQTIRGSRWDHASLCGRKKNRGCRNLSKLYFQDRTGQSVPKTFSFISCSEHLTNPCFVTPLSLNGLSSMWKTELGTKGQLQST